MKKFNIYVFEDNFDLEEHYKKDGMRNASRFTLVWGKLWCPNFVQDLDYSIFKSVDHCLK